MDDKTIDEVVDAEHEVGHVRGMARLARMVDYLSQVVDYLFYLVYGLLGLRLFLALVAARSGAGFVKFIHGVTEPLYLPFKGIVASPSLEGGYTLAVPLVVAILVYAMLHVAIRGLLRLVVQRKTEI